MFTLHDVLDRAGIAPTDANVMLHSPNHGNPEQVLPSLVKTRRRAMEAFQSLHSVGAEAALKRGRPWVLSFVKIGQDVPTSHSRMLFAGVYRNQGHRHRPKEEILADPEIVFLRETFSYLDRLETSAELQKRVWFDLPMDDALTELQGRLVLSVRLTPNYVRRAENLEATVRAIHEASVFDADPPDWRRWVLPAAQLRAIPPGWAARLREWRGIYLIVCRDDGARYVGSAYGETNLLGRWQAHVARDFGVTAELAARDPATFDFSILERVSPDMQVDTITKLEQGWMQRLHTRTHGLNA
ncbi:GIY-YIG nuclease family protein [uncultured Jannaschia sp.]|uniref:GIY-YIG nuclease family protein n=1 Tax=uncultured Jannaschia sp. TaxID=293347 RepID=UPI00262F7CB0|nr:GIY-YIG nuclease family protein [uncultured Jannaschia sp.]